MGDSSTVMGNNLGESGVVELTGKIMMIAIIILFLVVVFVFLLHVYAKWFSNRRQQSTNNAAPERRRRRRLDFAPGQQELAFTTALMKGLEPSVLKTIPVVVFSAKEFKDGLECAVCLCDVSEGEQARLLPKCNHGFHVDCIDMWFQSHSTCPLCRNPVANQSSSSSESTIGTNLRVPAEESVQSFPTNVLFWGNETQISTMGALEEVNQFPNAQPPTSTSSSAAAASLGSSSLPSSSGSIRPEGMLVIDIPRAINEEEESKSPRPTRLRSLKRLLSRDRRVTPCSPRDIDVEEGARAQR